MLDQIAPQSVVLEASEYRPGVLGIEYVRQNMRTGTTRELPFLTPFASIVVAKGYEGLQDDDTLTEHGRDRLTCQQLIDILMLDGYDRNGLSDTIVAYLDIGDSQVLICGVVRVVYGHDTDIEYPDIAPLDSMQLIATNWEELLQDIKITQIAEMGRFTVTEEIRNLGPEAVTLVTDSLYRSATEHCRDKGIIKLIAIMPSYVTRIMTAIQAKIQPISSELIKNAFTREIFYQFARYWIKNSPALYEFKDYEDQSSRQDP